MTTDLNALRQSAEKILGLRAEDDGFSPNSNGTKRYCRQCFGLSDEGHEDYCTHFKFHQACDTIAAMLPLIDRCERLERQLNTPETEDFMLGTRLEVAHQIQRWGDVHDRAKEPQDWFWLLGYLSGKALHAHSHGDREKALHHCISSAAVLANWHTHIKFGGGAMSTGSSDLQKFLTDTFGDAAMKHTDPDGEKGEVR